MRFTPFVFALSMFLATRGLGQEFYIEASRDAVVRDEPLKTARVLLHLERSEQLNVATSEQTNGFYNVFLPNGETGWVSRYVVRLHEGRVPISLGEVLPAPDSGLTARQREYAAFHHAIGKPRGYREIVREGYTVGYDTKLKIPIWVQYRLTAERSENDSFPRSNAFDEDAEIPAQGRATLEDYAGDNSGYVRGHMAPADDMRWSQASEQQSNLLTNIAPQIGSAFNGSIWKTIEDRVRSWVRDRRDLTIICGPVFEARPRVHEIERQPETDRQMLFNVIGSNDVAVPSAFFKIVVNMQRPQNPDVLAFLVPHIETAAGPERRIETYLTNIDRIEQLTGLDFLTNLPQNVQEEIERSPAMAVW